MKVKTHFRLQHFKASFKNSSGAMTPVPYKVVLPLPCSLSPSYHFPIFPIRVTCVSGHMMNDKLNASLLVNLKNAPSSPFRHVDIM